MKRTKIIYGIGISLIVLLIVGIVFYYMNFMKKVVCTREGPLGMQIPQTDTIIFEFKLDGTVKNALVEQVLEFDTEEAAKSYYDIAKDKDENIKALKNKNVILKFEKTLALNQKKYNRKKIMKTYKEFNYECK